MFKMFKRFFENLMIVWGVILAILVCAGFVIGVAYLSMKYFGETGGCVGLIVAVSLMISAIFAIIDVI